MSLSTDLVANNIILVITTKESYNNSIETIYPDLEKSANKIGYVTINRPYNTIVNSFKNSNVNKDKFIFVDAITASVQTPPAVEGCMFVSSPTALTDLGLALTSLFCDFDCDVVIFDTISTLIIYQDIGTVTKFVHNVVTKARVMGKKLVLVALKDDSETLVKDLNMFVDKIIEL